MDESMKHRIVGTLVLLAGSLALAPLVLRGQAVWSSSAPVTMPTPPGIAHPVVAQSALKPVTDMPVVSSGTIAETPIQDSLSAPQMAASSAPMTPANNVQSRQSEAGSLSPAEDPQAADEQMKSVPSKDKHAVNVQAKTEKVPVAQKKQEPLHPRSEPEQQDISAVPSGFASQGWTIQVASLEHAQAAGRLSSDLRQKGYHVYVRQSGSVWKVYVGPELDREAAQKVLRRLSSAGVQGWMQHYSLPVEDSVP